jgi:predicted ATPase
LGNIWRGWALAEEGQPTEGIAQLQEGVAAWRATGAEMAVSHYLSALAEAYARAGQVEEGLSTLSEGLALAKRNEERFYEAELYRLHGELSLQ